MVTKKQLTEENEKHKLEITSLDNQLDNFQRQNKELKNELEENKTMNSQLRDIAARTNKEIENLRTIIGGEATPKAKIEVLMDLFRVPRPPMYRGVYPRF